jgi:hypothetical protein
MELVNKIRGYRTLIVNAVAIIIALLVAVGVLPAAEFAGITEEKVGEGFDALAANVDALVAAIVAILAIINGVMRFLTKGAVGQKIT